jgi:hypothetical protein
LGVATVTINGVAFTGEVQLVRKATGYVKKPTPHHPAGSRSKEYVGYCINLASRLQKHCPEIAFVASARVRLPETTLRRHGYIRVIAKTLRSFPPEIVIVDKDDYDGLSQETREQYFSGL